MAMHSRQALYDELQVLVNLVDQQMDVIKQQAESAGINPMQVRYSDGKFAMVDLLVARTQAVSGMAQLRAAGGKR